MRTAIKKVYYCDYCKKHYLSSHWCKRHEEKCTMNPNRLCNLCQQTTNLPELVAKFKKSVCAVAIPDERYGGYYYDGVEQPSVSELRDAVDGCPVCTLALIRQIGIGKYPFDSSGFNYKKELAEWWVEERSFQ